jgi:hypothetical protein
VDWAHWRASARGLAVDHPTVARDYEPLPGGLRAGDPAQAAAAAGVEGAESATFAAIRQAHGPLLDRVKVAARSRGLAIPSTLIGNAPPPANETDPPPVA